MAPKKNWTMQNPRNNLPLHWSSSACGLFSFRRAGHPNPHTMPTFHIGRRPCPPKASGSFPASYVCLARFNDVVCTMQNFISRLADGDDGADYYDLDNQIPLRIAMASSLSSVHRSRLLRQNLRLAGLRARAAWSHVLALCRRGYSPAVASFLTNIDYLYAISVVAVGVQTIRSHYSLHSVPRLTKIHLEMPRHGQHVATKVINHDLTRFDSAAAAASVADGLGACWRTGLGGGLPPGPRPNGQLVPSNVTVSILSGLDR